MVEIVPSILSVGFRRRGDEIAPAIGGGADLNSGEELARTGCGCFGTVPAVFHSADAAATVRQMPGIAANALAVRV